MNALAELMLRKSSSPGEFTILMNNVCSRFGGFVFVIHNCLVGISDAPIV